MRRVPPATWTAASLTVHSDPGIGIEVCWV
jgi:hypothetical protein